MKTSRTRAQASDGGVRIARLQTSMPHRSQRPLGRILRAPCASQQQIAAPTGIALPWDRERTPAELHSDLADHRAPPLLRLDEGSASGIGDNVHHELVDLRFGLELPT